MADWTRAQVEDRLESAAEVMRALPGVKPQGHFSTWPEYLHSFADKVGQEPEMRRPRPSPRAISEAEEAMLWLRWLDPELGKLVWARVSGIEWKPICWQFGISRPTAHRRWEYGLSVIVWRLNGRWVPTKRARRYVLEGAQLPQSRLSRDFMFGPVLSRHDPGGVNQRWPAWRTTRAAPATSQQWPSSIWPGSARSPTCSAMCAPSVCSKSSKRSSRRRWELRTAP